MTLILAIVNMIVCGFLARKETKKAQAIFTPFFCLTMPYSLLLLYVSILDLFKDDVGYRMSFLVPVLSLALFVLFYVLGNLRRATKPVQASDYDARNDSGKGVTVVLFILLSLLILTYLKSYGVALIGSSDFKSYFSLGVQGHLVNIITATFLYAVTNKSLKGIRYISIIWAAFLAIGNAKYMMISYALALIIIYYFTTKRFSLKKALALIAVVATLFIFTYAMRLKLDGSPIDFKFIFAHFNYYLVGGFYAFSKVLTTSISPTPGMGIGLIFAPIINIVKLLSGDTNYVTSISKFIEVDINSTYQQTNVFTLFGSIYFEMGAIWLIVITVFLAIFSYYVYNKAMQGRNKSVLAIYAFLMGTFFCSFFNCFYGTLNFWEVVLILVFYGLLHKMRVTNKSKLKVNGSIFATNKEKGMV